MDKTKFGLILEDQTVERERGEEKREEEEEEGRGEEEDQIHVCFCLGIIGIWILKVGYGDLLLPCLGLCGRDHPNPRIIESKVGKTPNIQEKHGILPLRLDLRFNCKVKGLG